jgi:hypothetical protein
MADDLTPHTALGDVAARQTEMRHPKLKYRN